MANEIDIWMPLFIGDYLADTMHLACLEHGAYLLLLMHYWRTGSLPNNDKKLAAIAKLHISEWKEVRDSLTEFFTITDTKWVQKRLEIERTAAIERKAVSVAKAKAAADARWNASSITPSNPQGMLEQCPSPSSSSLSSKTSEPATKESPNGDSEKPSVISPCPYEKLVELYHSNLTGHRRVRRWTDNRKRIYRARWVEMAKEGWSIDDWDWYFKRVATSDFLCGKVQTNGRHPFIADLDWLMNQTNMTKVLEGKYHGK